MTDLKYLHKTYDKLSSIDLSDKLDSIKETLYGLNNDLRDLRENISILTFAITTAICQDKLEKDVYDTTNKLVDNLKKLENLQRLIKSYEAEKYYIYSLFAIRCGEDGE